MNATLHTTSVDLRGLMVVLGNNLYSTPIVAVRELVQNAHDACVRRKIEAPKDPFAPAIRVSAELSPPTLIVEDDGAGLTGDEVRSFLATVGTGMTRKLREAGTGPEADAEAGALEESLIGMFGLGFLSAFVIGERVTVVSTSHKSPETTHRYQSHTGETYTLETCDVRPVGTRVEIRLKANFHHLSRLETLRPVLEKYCALLPIPVFVSTAAGESAAVNGTPPPWRSSETNRVKQEREQFAFAERLEKRFSPMAVLPVTSTTTDTDVRGLLWLQDGGSYATSDNRSLVVYVRGMMLDDDGRDLLPKWAGFLSGAIESKRLVPTASREDLQRDEVYAATAKTLEAALISGLARLSKEAPATWQRILARHNEALLGAALASPPLFELLADELTVPTSEGDLRLRPLLKRGNGTIYLSLSDHGGFEEMLFRALQTPVVVGIRFGAAGFSERYVEAFGGRVVRLGTDSGNREVFRPASDLSVDAKAQLEAVFGQKGREIVPARFAPTSVPFVLVPDRDAELKARIESNESAKRISTAALGLARLFTHSISAQVTTRLFVNVDSPAIARLVDTTRPVDVNGPGTVLLRSLVPLLAGGGVLHQTGLADSLAEYTRIVTTLLDAEAP